MWQKVNPFAFRLKTTTAWNSIYFSAVKSIWGLVIEDGEIRSFLSSKLSDAWIARYIISRNNNQIIVDIYTSKPWVVIWRQWSQIDELKKALDLMFSSNFELNVKEIKKPDLEAVIVAWVIARSIENRVAYRRAIKQAISKCMEAWAKWVKVSIWWRLNWAEIARSETYKEWSIPLHTIRTDISYSTERANTTYWVIWIKVWIYRWEVFSKNN